MSERPVWKGGTVKLRTRFVLAVLLLVALVFGLVVAAQLLAVNTDSAVAHLGGPESILLSQLTHGYGQATADVYLYAMTGEPRVTADLDDHLSLMRRSQTAFAKHEGTAGRPGAGESALDTKLSAELVPLVDIFANQAEHVVADRARSGAIPVITLAAFSSTAHKLEDVLASTTEFEAAKTTESARGMAANLSQLVWVVGLCGLAVVVVGSFAAVVIYLSISRPIHVLKSASAALAEGDMSYPVDMARRDEFGELNRAFISMRTDLEDSMIRLRGELDQRTAAQAKLEDAMTGVSTLNAELDVQVHERLRVDRELESANSELSDRLHEVATVSREMSILAEMGAMLQSDVASEEAFDIIGRYAGAIMPGTSGALYAMSDSRNMLDVKASWGGSAPSALDFGPGDCWALRLGRPHAPDEEHVLTDCAHVDGDETGDYLCVPLSAQGDFVGVLTVYDTSAGSAPGEFARAARERTHRLAVTFAEQVALALSNLKLRDTLREQSIRDPLTGLYNRRFMEDSVEREAARAKRNAHPISFVMLDIDHFKDYNDNAGHGAGDAVLAAMGRYIRDVTRTDDVACRYGGEEFLLVWPTMDADGALHRAQELQQGIKALSVQEGDRILPGITVSVGVAVLDVTSDETADDAIRAADAALYRAKAGGRDRVMTADDLRGDSARQAEHRESDAA
jgi:diguanylate cyclase (GGDEF)-like protein